MFHPAVPDPELLVPKMIPDAKALTLVKVFPSGWRKETSRLKRGAETPIMLVKRMAMIDMIFRGNALALLTHGFVDSASHSLGAFTSPEIR